MLGILASETEESFTLFISQNLFVSLFLYVRQEDFNGSIPDQFSLYDGKHTA